MAKNLSPLEGHEFTTSISVAEDDQGQPIGIDEEFAGCSCGWQSEQGHCPPNGDDSDAEASVKMDWERRHYPEAARTAVPMDLVARVRDVESALDELTQVHPLAALRLAVQSGGVFSTKAKEAALQASLDHSWAEIGSAIGISKQAAWERYGKYRTTDSA